MQERVLGEDNSRYRSTLHFRTRIATPRLNAPWEGVADGASGFHGNAASTAPTLRTEVVPTRVESVAARDGGGSSDGGATGTKGDGNRPSGTVTVGASPFDAAPVVRTSLRGDRKEIS